MDIDYRNSQVQKLLDEGGKLIPVQFYAVQKVDGNIVWPTNDYSNKVLDNYACVTDVGGQVIVCHRSKTKDNPFAKIIYAIGERFNIRGSRLEKVASFVAFERISELSDKVFDRVEKFLGV